MTRKQTPWAAALVAVALQAMTVTNAFGLAVKWLLNGELLLEAKTALVHTAMRLVHEGGLIGKYKIECTMLTGGTVGPLAEDSIGSVQSLTGESGILTCKAVEGLCETPVYTVPVHLSWKTTLSYEEGVGAWDALSSSGAGEPEWDMLCDQKGALTHVVCGAKYRERFTENSVNGAVYVWEGKTSGVSTCTDGGKAFLEQPAGTHNVVLGFTTS